MFEKFMEKFNKREEEEQIEFKVFEQIEAQASVKEPEEEIKAPEQKKNSDSVELKVIRPEAYEEVSTVADSLLAGCTVVLNLEVLDKATIHRMLDFLNGVTYCTDGEIKKVAPNTFIITPHSNVDISDM